MPNREIIKQTMDKMNHAVIICDKDCKFIYWNEAAKKVLVNYETVKDNANWTQHYGIFKVDKKTQYEPDDFPIVKATKKACVINEKIFVTNADVPHGVFLEVDAFPLFDDEGKVCGGVASFNDITRQVMVEDFVLHIQAKLEQVTSFLKKI